jgi:YD repeat-containing protein
MRPTGDKSKNQNGCQDYVGDPIVVSSGTAIQHVTDFAVPGEMGLSFERIYNSSAINPFLTTSHWKTNFDYMLDVLCGGLDRCVHVYLYRPDGSAIQFLGQPSRANADFPEQGGNGLATLHENADLTYTLHDEDGTIQTYDETGRVLSITNPSGISWTYAYSFDAATSSYTTRITHTNGQSVAITTYGFVGGVGQRVVVDPAGNTYTYQLNSAGDYTQATQPGTPTTVYGYKYDNQGHLTEIDVNGAPYSYTTYDTSGRANATYLADGSQLTSIVYGSNATGPTAAITNALGYVQTNQYDSQNRLVSVAGAGMTTCGSTVNGRTYDSNGYLAGTVDNNTNTHSYTYAANGQLQTETEAYGAAVARKIDYTWDPNQQLNRPQSVTVEGWSRSTYSYTAQNRLASVAVTNLSGNGNASQTLTTTYSYGLYGNGMVQTMTVTRPSPNGSDTTTTTYDTLGRVTSVTNGLSQTTTYSNYNGLGQAGHVVGPNGNMIDYTYDARGRLMTTTNYPNGSAATWTYTYDGYGLPHTLTGPDGQVTTWNRDSRTWVTSITHNDKDGTSTQSFSYDANGDVLQRSMSRNGTTTLLETTHYDALGRIYQKIGQHGQSLTYMYDGNGNVQSATDAVGHVVTYQYDALNRVIQTTESGGASPAAPTLTTPSASSNGSFSAVWTAIPQATSYNLQEQVNGGAWSTVSSGASTSWNTSGRSNGSYSYQVQACYVGGCGPWSTITTTTVLYAPSSAPTVTTPANNTSGSYTVSWSGVSTATSYNLQEQVNGGAWATVQSNGASTWGANGKGNATYGYRVQACNSSGCGPWSGISNTTVLLPPPTPTGVSAPATSSGTFTITWNASSTATSYDVHQSINNGTWTLVKSVSTNSATIVATTSGNYTFYIAALNGSGWNGQVGASNVVVVTIPPASAPTLSVPTNNTTGSYTVSWSGVAGATSYTLQERTNGGGWSTVQANGSTSWNAASHGSATYGYQVQACNAGGCSSWSSVASISVLLPPGSAPTVSVPATSANGSYTITWNAIAGATSYIVSEQDNGGSWYTLASGVTATSLGVSGRGNGSYGHGVVACNASGCGPWSSAVYVTVLFPPPAPSSVTAPSYIHGVQYYVSWSASNTATSYNVIRNGVYYGSTSATSYTIPAPGSTDTIQWGAQACNASGCSGTTNAPNVTNTDPPGPIH